MQARQTPMAVAEDNVNLFTLAADGRTIRFMVPFPLDAIDLLVTMDGKGLSGFSKKVAKASGDASLRAQILIDTRELWTIGGAAIGMCWADLDMELETAFPAGHDPGRFGPYGEAVLRELHMAGFTVHGLTMLMPAVLSRVASTAVTKDKAEQAEERADFSEAPEAKAT